MTGADGDGVAGGPAAAPAEGLWGVPAPLHPTPSITAIFGGYNNTAAYETSTVIGQISASATAKNTCKGCY